MVRKPLGEISAQTGDKAFQGCVGYSRIFRTTCTLTLSTARADSLRSTCDKSASDRLRTAPPQQQSLNYHRLRQQSDAE